ncbi:hypothetical protein [Blastococcus sp. VKM Ac-2987]|uniref:hypothetical protein n=1 Tax=Blastococcus sp. VKM Ac-2987 TaxID=3004141 RepID=UPI0022AB5A61|nr:hypothetical protein [Blastococcus sp. VKM Ac-2987]MCZ2858433.1 hypothetical protein [Blastococcus sp. VKM Ac-2987]
MTGLLVLLLGAAVSGAAPALAIDDPTRPDVRVTHGPSCRPGGIVVEVVAGTAPYDVRLTTTRRPAGEDEATLAAQGSVVLRTGDVAPGETIDPRVEFTARDGSGFAYADELADYTLTRPTVADCEAALSPPPPPPAPPTAAVEPTSPSPSASAGGTTAGSLPTAPRTPRGTTTPDTAPPTTTSSGATTTPSAGGATPVASTPSRSADTAAAPAPGRPGPSGTAQVQPGGTVTLHGAGFIPGEQVRILLHGSDTLLATATADRDGEVRVDVRIPAGAPAGLATLDLVGADSAVSTGVDLRVASATEPVAPARGALSLASLVAAAVALVATAAGLVSVVGLQHADRRGHGPVPTS